MNIQENDVILIGGTLPLWTNCLMQVDEVRSWGVIGSVIAPEQKEYPLRVGNDEIAAVYRKVDQ